jgi:hypothetical protein
MFHVEHPVEVADEPVAAKKSDRLAPPAPPPEPAIAPDGTAELPDAFGRSVMARPRVPHFELIR